MNKSDIIVIGGGAAGIFSAVTAAFFSPQATITVLEKSGKFLSKVKISGGGRCNVTHACYQSREMARHYPRGEKFLKKVFRHYMSQDIIKWFESRGVKLKTEPDGRIFPVTNSSETIINTLLSECNRKQVRLYNHKPVTSLEKSETGYIVKTKNGENFHGGRIIIAPGGSPQRKGLTWLEQHGHEIEDPVPSLFTFHTSDSEIKALQGITISEAEVRVPGHKHLRFRGNVLITHWGFSGPAILKLSAWGARKLFNKDYSFTLMISWLPSYKQDDVNAYLEERKQVQPDQQISNHRDISLPKRLWQHLIQKAGIPDEKRWKEMNKKEKNRLVEILLNDTYEITGKSTFKEEFVTCGGIRLNQIHPDSMESSVCPGLFFAGEILDIDGITGGFNFQSAWSTGYLAGKAAAEQVVTPS